MTRPARPLSAQAIKVLPFGQTHHAVRAALGGHGPDYLATGIVFLDDLIAVVGHQVVFFSIFLSAIFLSSCISFFCAFAAYSPLAKALG